MPISKDIFLAILAMDSYNRGDSVGLNVAGSQIGNASLLSVALPVGYQTASFFAQAYTINGSSISGLSDGQTIISYRGTDNFFADPVTGWPIAIGDYTVAQAERRNLGTFSSRKAAEKHERDVQYFKRHSALNQSTTCARRSLLACTRARSGS